MALETGSYINDLTITNPTGSDPVSAGDDHIRLLKTVLKECFAGFTGAILITATESGTAAAHVLTPSTALVGYTTGLMLLYRPTNAGTGALTVNVSGLGAKNVKTILGADPTSGDIVANQPILLMYDGTNFVILAGSEILMRTGNQTMTGDLTLTGSQTISGTLAVTGALTGASMTAKANKAGETYTGPHNFTGATITAATQVAGTSTTDVATCAFVVAQAFSAILPGQTGNAGKVLGTDGSNASWVSAGPQVSNKTADYTMLTSDLGKVITLTGATSRTFTTPAAATAAAGWYCYVHNNCDDTAAASNPVTMTIDGNSAETIDGVTTITEYKNGALLLMTDGSNWFTVRISGGFARFVQTGTFTWPTRVTNVLADVFGAGGGGARPNAGSGGTQGAGGGARRTMPIPLLAVNTTTTATVGAAGVGATTTATSGTAGGQSSFSSVKAGGGCGGGAGGGGGGVDNSTSAVGGLPTTTTGSGIVLGSTSGYLSNIGFGGAAGATAGVVGGNAEYGGGGGGAAATVNNGYAGGSSIMGGGAGGGSGGVGNTTAAGIGGAGGSNNSTSAGGGGAGGAVTPTAGTAGTARDFAAGDGGGGGGSDGTTGAAGGAGGVPSGGGGSGGAGNSTTGNGGNGGRGEVRIWYR